MSTPMETTRMLLELGGKILHQTEPLKLECTREQAISLGFPPDLVAQTAPGDFMYYGEHVALMIPDAPVRAPNLEPAIPPEGGNA